MLCLAALIIFAGLGIFSAKHRAWAREAWECVLNRARLRPCESAFGSRVKASWVGWLMQHNYMGMARLVQRYVEIWAWAFVLLSLLSLLYVSRGFYYLLTRGTCTPSQPEKCLLRFDKGS